jgi:hypothetical protein
MKRLGAKVLHKSLLLGLGAMIMHTACSNSNFRSTSSTAVTENASSSEDATPEEDNGIQTAPISSYDLDVPAALKPAPDSLFSQYPTTVLKNAETQFTLDLKDVTAKVNLVDKTAPKTESFPQNTRTATTDPFKQGNPGQEVINQFTQAGKKGDVDILVVIDNSGSMDKEQVNLSTKMDALLASIKDANWQISVINTHTVINGNLDNTGRNDPATEGQETCISTLIKKGDANAADEFSKAIKAGTSGSGYEQGIRQAVVGLRCPGKTVVRAGSTLAVLIVSDEDNCSQDGSDCGSTKWAKETYLIDYVEKTLGRTVGKNAGFYGIIAPSKDLCKTALNAGTQYVRLFNYKSTPGVNYGNICDADYAGTLNRISDSIALQLDNTFTLSEKPEPGSLVVTVTSPAPANVTTTVNPNDYTVTEKSLKFAAGKEPANGSTIRAIYRINAVPMFNSVTLRNDPAAGTISVTVNGAMLDAGSYTVSGRIITFATRPAANADIKVNYRMNMPLADTFQLAGSPIGGVTVKVKNVATTNFSYDAATRKVKLNFFPLDAEIVEVSYTAVDGPELQYPVSIATGAKNFRLLDGATALNYTLDPGMNGNGKITINQADHKAGKELMFTYELPDGAERRFPLAGMPEPGTVTVSMMAGTCVVGQNIKVQGMELIATCPVAEKTEFVLSYKYKIQVKSFTLSGAKDPEKGIWAVYYNKELTTEFTREGTTITLNFEPAVDSKVDIVYTFPE